jgi:His/Glu/Gln/Arg/opine family amino acid ABC transporter permease subunit
MFDLKGYGHLLLDGALLTIEIAVCSFAIVVLLGLVGAAGKLSGNRFARNLAEAYTSVVRGIPELVLLLLVYYGGTVLVQNLGALLFNYTEPIDINRFIAGTLVLGFIYGAFATEVFRGAFQSIAHGQLEAARAFGMSDYQVFWRISLPQAWRFAIPGLGNVWLVLVKATAITSVIGLTELTGQAVIIKIPTREPFTVFLIAGALYLALTACSDYLRHRIEGFAGRGMRFNK